ANRSATRSCTYAPRRRRAHDGVETHNSQPTGGRPWAGKTSKAKAMHRKRRKKDAGPEIELPITPMLDMAFQLLTFFIFTYHPSALEGQIEMDLPMADAAKAPNQAEAQPTETDTEVPTPSDLTVIVKTKPDKDSEPTPSKYV